MCVICMYLNIEIGVYNIMAIIKINDIDCRKEKKHFSLNFRSSLLS